MAWGLALVLAAAVAAQACPDHCSCSHQQGLYVANCSVLPSSAGKIEALTLLPPRSPLELLDGQFNSARHLKYLNLRNCSIYFIHKKTFYGAKSVIEVDLSYNQIEEFDSTVFQHLNSLTTLILRGNPIQFLSEVPFLISNSLQHLDIGDCRIKHIPRGVFYGLKRIKYLSLDGNLLKSIKYNSLPKGLKYIDLSNNHIVNVPTEVISSLTNLRRLGLGGNPINCSCSLLNLQDWLSGRGVIFENDVICALPHQYKGVSWSKVDENTLCLAEARREEIYHPMYNPFRSRLYKQDYFDNDNSYSGEPIQSDQPQPYINSDAEVFMQNDETEAMGVMQRNEDGPSGVVGDEPKPDQTESEAKQEESEPTDTENKENQEPDDESSKKLNENPVPIVSEYNSDNEEISNTETKETPENLEMKPETPAEETDDLNDDKPVEFKNLSEDNSNTETDDLKNEGLLHAESKSFVETNSTDDGSTVIPDIDETTGDEAPSTEETPVLGTPETDEENEETQNVASSTETNNATVIEPEVPEEEGEGTIPPPTIIPDLHSESDLNKTNTKEEIEESQNIGSSTETINGTIVGTVVQPEEIEEPIEPPRIIPEVHSENSMNSTNTSAIIAPEVEPEKTTQAVDVDKKELAPIIGDEKIKQVAGAEVVMFCVAVLIVCLILYSVYRCRSKKRQSVRIVKEKPSNRDTEMQDMASLLPKPQDDEKKNNSKYPEKAPSSETEKLIAHENEKEIPTVTPISETKDKDKNTLNNNTADANGSPTSKTPLIQSGKPVTVVPAAPIQRTKVKVGIIPDSIPRTPIFLQKTYNGTTKNV